MTPLHVQPSKGLLLLTTRTHAMLQAVLGTFASGFGGAAEPAGQNALRKALVAGPAGPTVEQCVPSGPFKMCLGRH